MVKVKLKLHQSLWVENEPNEFQGEFENLTVIDIIDELLDEFPRIKELCLTSKKKKKPGILYISEKTELSSLGLLEIELENDLELRIVPVLHGG